MEIRAPVIRISNPTHPEADEVAQRYVAIPRVHARECSVSRYVVKAAIPLLRLPFMHRKHAELLVGRMFRQSQVTP